METTSYRIYNNRETSGSPTIIEVPFIDNQSSGDYLGDNVTETTAGDQKLYFSTSAPPTWALPPTWDESNVNYRLPDPDDSAGTDRYITFAEGTYIRYQYYKESPTTRRLIMYAPQILVESEYESIGPSHSIIDSRFTDAVEVYWNLLFVNKVKYRNYDVIIADNVPSFYQFVRPNYGSYFGDYTFNGVFSAEALNISELKPNFKPTDGNAVSGGLGWGDYSGVTNGEEMDVDARNGIFSFCSLDGNGLTCYRLSSKQAFLDVLNGCYSLGSVKDNSYLRDALVSAYLLPALTGIPTTSIHGIRVGDNTFLQEPSYGNQSIVTKCLSNEYSCIYNLKENDGWGDLNDFVSSKYTLYLPFVGSVNIDANALVRGYIQVKFTVNLYNGNIVYWVYTKSFNSETNTLYGTYSGNCAIQIPTCGAGESGSVLGKITNTVSALATGAASIATGNPLGVASAGLGIMEAWTPTYNVDRAGTIDTNSTTQQAYEIRLKISKPVVLRDGEFSDNIRGKSSFYSTTINNLPKGYHVITDIDLNTVNASDAEKQRIKSILKGGVFV